MKKGEYKYSIIIPHCDIPVLLERCLRSIPIRKDVQIIVVDDCSNETIVAKLKEIEKDFPHVLYIYSEEKGGAGRARNIGISHATGDYIFFADADDLFTDSFDEILNHYIECDKDIVYFRNISVLSDDLSVITDRSQWIDELFDRYFETGVEDEIRCIIPMPWAKMFKRTFILENNIAFDETPFANDMFFVTTAGCKAKRIEIANTIIYIYTERVNSLSAAFLEKPGELRIRAEACFRAQKVIKEYGYKFHFMPMTDFMVWIFHRDKKMYREYLLRASEIYDSTFDAIRQTHWRERNKGYKILIVIYSVIILVYRMF